MSMMTTWIDFADAFNELARDHAEWSQATFGSDQERGPIGALKHLEREAREAQAAPSDPTEYADCFLLILDAARRAGINPMQLVEHAKAKMQVNRSREWPKPTTDEPVEHVRSSPQMSDHLTDERIEEMDGLLKDAVLAESDAPEVELDLYHMSLCLPRPARRTGCGSNW